MFNFSTAKLIVVTTLIFVGSALIGCWQTSSAQGWWDDDAVSKKLELSDKTVQELKGKRYETQQEVAELHGQLRAARLKLREILEQEKSDKAEVDRTIEKIYDLQTQIHKTRVHHLLFAKDQLTPEQRQKIKKVLKRRIRGQVGQASARTGQLYEPVPDRMNRRDRGRVLQRLDRQQRMRDQTCEPQWQRQRPVRGAAQSPFAARGQVGQASGRTGQLYEPVPDRMNRQDRGRVLQRLDGQQRMRDQTGEPQWQRQRPVRGAAQSPFAARGQQYRTGHAGRYSRFDAPFPRVPTASQALKAE